MAEIPTQVMRVEAEVVVTGLRVGDLLVPITADGGAQLMTRPLCHLDGCVLDPGHRLAHRDGNGTVLKEDGSQEPPQDSETAPSAGGTDL